MAKTCQFFNTVYNYHFYFVRIFWILKENIFVEMYLSLQTS